MIKSLWNDEAGVVLSAEIVLIGTIVVLGLIVGLQDLTSSVNQELDDLGNAIGNLNQGYTYKGWLSKDSSTKAMTVGSAFQDGVDDCDAQSVTLNCTSGTVETSTGL